MTRINTNVSSLLAQTNLSRSNAQLQTSLTRLSTGLRINSGKDDPSGLIASENLRSDIVAVQAAIGNSERANQVIATADSSLGQVSSLLNDIRGLVTESANSGGLSDEQIAANQLQVDSSLEALNRIAQTTSFQGRRLLDGSLDFITSSSDADFAQVTDLQIDQANLGANASLDVSVVVNTAATQAAIATSVSVTAAGTQGSLAVDLGAVDGGDASTTGTLDLSTLIGGASTGTITISAADSGTSLDGVNVIITDDNTLGSDEATASFNGTDTITIRTNGTAVDTADIVAAFDSLSEFTASEDVAGTVNSDADVAGIASSSGTIDLAAQIGGATTGEISVTATSADTSLDGVTIQIVDGSPVTGNADVAFNGTDTITITTDTDTVTTADIVNAFSDISEFSATEVTAGTILSNTDVGGTPVTLGTTSGARDVTTALGTTANGRAAAGTFTLSTDDNTDTYNGVTVELVQDGALAGAADPVVAELITDGNGNPTTLRFRVDGTNNAIALADFQTALDNSVDTNGVFSISGAAGGTLDGSAAGTVGSEDDLGDIDSGADDTAGLADDVVFELIGSNGTEVFQFDAGTAGSAIAAAINLVADATGVSATYTSGTGALDLNSVAYGTSSVVQVNIISEGGSGTFESGFSGTLRDTGTDVDASVNGVQASGDGNRLSINTATLDLSTSVAAGFTGTIDFSIDGGGALFQLGPDVVSNQQARVGIRSVNTGRLGGVSGKLFQLGAGGSAALDSDTTTAALIVEEAIDQITSLRGRLGAFQKTTIETNIAALNDTLVNLTDAESAIRDADFAAETANLTRAQILVQSGGTVLSIANSNPQNVLALLR
ncbi:MAG: hypothetical protein KDA42_05065 [Planctomycetales bacterium]|nr:hypothetical protein [Planctomycetales bacterium]